MKFGPALPLAFVYALGVTALSVHTFWAEYPQRDFTAFYFSIADYWTTGALYAPHVNRNLNPPHASIVLFSPLILLPMAWAAVAWFIGTAALVALSLAIIRNELRLSNTYTLWLIAAVSASAASQHNLDQGQLGAVLMFLCTMGWRSARRNRSAAPWLALAVSIKPPLALWVFAQHRKDVFRTIAIGATVLVAGVILIGPDAWRDWFTAMNANSSAPVPSNLSIFGALIRASWSTDAELPRQVLIILWSAASVCLAVISWKARSGDADERWLLWGLTAILISPVGWNYYLLALVGPLTAWLLNQRWAMSIRTPLFLLMLPTQAVFVLWVLHPMLGSVYSLAALFLWGAVIYRHRRAPALAQAYAVPARATTSTAVRGAPHSRRETALLD